MEKEKESLSLGRERSVKIIDREGATHDVVIPSLYTAEYFKVFRKMERLSRWAVNLIEAIEKQEDITPYVVVAVEDCREEFEELLTIATNKDGAWLIENTRPLELIEICEAIHAVNELPDLAKKIGAVLSRAINKVTRSA